MHSIYLIIQQPVPQAPQALPVITHTSWPLARQVGHLTLGIWSMSVHINYSGVRCNLLRRESESYRKILKSHQRASASIRWKGGCSSLLGQWSRMELVGKASWLKLVESNLLIDWWLIDVKQMYMFKEQICLGWWASLAWWGPTSARWKWSIYNVWERT